jgi:hypothetical protein
MEWCYTAFWFDFGDRALFLKPMDRDIKALLGRASKHEARFGDCDLRIAVLEALKCGRVMPIKIPEDRINQEELYHLRSNKKPPSEDDGSH